MTRASVRERDFEDVGGFVVVGDFGGVGAGVFVDGDDVRAYTPRSADREFAPFCGTRHLNLKPW